MTVPVNMQLRPGKDVVVGRRHVLIGLDVITKKGDMLGLLGRLIAPAAGNSNQSRGKGKSKKRRDRAEPIDAIAYRIADASNK